MKPVVIQINDTLSESIERLKAAYESAKLSGRETAIIVGSGISVAHVVRALGVDVVHHGNPHEMKDLPEELRREVDTIVRDHTSIRSFGLNTLDICKQLNAEERPQRKNPFVNASAERWRSHSHRNKKARR